MTENSRITDPTKTNGLTSDQLQEFMERLRGPEGCNFHYEGEEMSENFRWRCKNSQDKDLSREILKKMNVSKEDVEDFLSWCESTGGFCDCEILWNSAMSMDDEWGLNTDEDDDEDFDEDAYDVGETDADGGDEDDLLVPPTVH